MKLSEQIEFAQTELTKLKDELVEATKALEAAPDEDALLGTVTDLTEKVEKRSASLEALKKAEAALAERLQKGSPTIITSTGDAKDAKDLWVKEAVVNFLAHVQRKSPDQVRQERYGTNKALEEVMRYKTAIPLATTFTAGWAAELVQSDVQGFVDLLTPLSVAAAVASRSPIINFNGFDSVTIPRRNARSATNTLAGAFVGEGGAIPLGRLSVGSNKLSRYKHAVISLFSRELSDRSTPSIEGILRQAILDDFSMALDAVYLGSAAEVVGVQPAGLLNGVVPIAGAAGGGSDAVIADIKAAVGAMTAAGLGARLLMLLNSNDALSAGLMQNALGDFMFRDDLASGRLIGIEVIRSLNVPADTMILLDASVIAHALDPVSFDVNDVATVVEANADAVAPTHATGAAGAIGTAGQVPRTGGIPVSGGTGAATVGAVARSLWQTYSVGIRAIQPVSWGLITPGGVVAVNGLTW